METLYLWVGILLLLEFFELFMQRADMLGGVMARLYRWYAKSIFLFFAIHPTFYFVLFTVLATDILNFPMVVIIAMKVFDIFYKIELIRAIYIRRSVPPDMAAMLEWRIPSWFFLTGVSIYPPLFFFALT